MWFSEGPIPSYPVGEYPYGGDTSYEGTPYTCDGYANYIKGNSKGLPAFSYRDVGIVVLTEPVLTSVVSEYAQLPSAGLVDTLSVNTAVDLVGYGVQYQLEPRKTGPRDAWVGLRQRFYAPSKLLSGELPMTKVMGFLEPLIVILLGATSSSGAVQTRVRERAALPLVTLAGRS